MKRLVYLFSALLAFAMISGCKPNIVPVKIVDITIQLMSDNAPLAVADVEVSLSDAAGTATFVQKTDAAGTAAFQVNPGNYTASASFKTVEDGKSLIFNGSNPNILVVEQPAGAFNLELQKVVRQQIIIKELYSGGCPKEGGAFQNDKYLILYNNSEFEADASDLVICALNPYNASSPTDKFYTADGLVYEKENWLPAGGVIWHFTSPVKMPAYSQIVIAFFGAIDHTATIPASVNLANAEYYWMSNLELPAITNSKYVVSDVIPKSHYLGGYQINLQNAWTFSNTDPALCIAKIGSSELKELCTNTEAFDFTAGTTDVGWSVKLPKSSVIGALEIYTSAKIELSHPRFSADINTGYAVLTNQLGYSIYRNVDKEATEALPENAGKLVYNYALGTAEEGGTTDPSDIDAEASFAAGAHIIYQQTNDSGKDYHQRRIASLKK